MLYWTVITAVWNVDPCVIYPLRGVQYFSTHPALWGNLLLLAVPQLTLTTAVIAVAFAFLYPAQAVLAFLLNGPAGIVASFIGMFQQSMSIVRSISELFLFPKPLRILFDGVLVQEGMDSLILTGRMQAPASFEQSDYHRVMSWIKALPRKLVFPTWLVMVLLRFFLSFIPVIGPIVLVVLDGPATAARCLGRYFDLKGWNDTQIEAFVAQNRWKFHAFGLLAAALESVPFIGFAFAFTNTIGGALWAVRLEREYAAYAFRGRRLRK